ncbi:MAG: PD-(D/E)XK nuclease family protein, partial [Myxococcales bacterium]|nr:PD-(D/E)XK nuclease family protein [Myxococcales bacterium]
PRDPADPARDDAGVAFTLRFAERLSAIGELSRFESAPPPSRVRILRAPGPTAELHAVASRIRALLDAGAIPERIGVVARDLARLRLPLRRHFAHLAIPHSGHGETGALTPVARRVEALLVLMRRGGAAPAELFVDVVERIEVATDTDAATDSGPRDLSHTERADLAWALHAAGVARLDGLAALGGSPPPARDLPLDVRTGLSLRPDGSTASERRRVSRQLFGAIAKRAAAFVERWSQGAVRASLAEYGEALVDLASVELGWTPGAAGVTAPGSAGDLLAQGVRFDAASAAVEVDREEFLLLLERRLVGAGREALGGRGGGVQVLSVMEARSRTFDHLFVIGLEAGSFPRSIQEGPILPDALRRNLRSVLPDLPVKAEGHDEERFLFAQLVEASPDVVLSVSVCDDDGKPRSVSPFVERLQVSDRAVESVTLPTLWSRRGLATGAAANPDESRLRPAHELLQLTGLYGSRVQFGEALTAALAGSPGGAALANARLAVLSELDPGYALRSELGPYFGFVGGAREPADPRRADLYVTTVESLCGCPWRTFLERLLHVAPAPDALATLPDLDALVIGAATHRVLEEIVFAHLGERGEPLDSALARTPAAIPWPDGPTLRSLVQKQAERALSEAGIAWPALAAALAERMAAFLDSARRIAWPGPAAEIGVLGVEVTGRVEVARAAGEPRSVYFRADRVDRTQDGALLLWDYKTGKPVAVQQSEQRRRTALLKKVQRGDFLQGAAYALGARALAGGAAEGRYLYLSPDAPPQAQVARVPADDEEFQAGFERAASRAVAALDAGSFFPRLVVASGEKEFPLCDRCDVRDACARGDSGARRRLVSWHAARSQAFRLAQEAEPTPDAVSGAARAEAAALAIWQLHEVER